MAVYRAKLNGTMLSVGLTMRALLARMSPEHVRKFLTIVGRELRSTNDERVIEYNFYALPPGLWQQVPEIPRMRIENTVLSNLKQGQLADNANVTGTLAICAKEHFPYFSEPEAIRREFVRKLNSSSESQMRYVVSNFFLTIPTFVASGPDMVINSRAMDGFVVALELFMREGDQRIYAELVQNFEALPPEWQDALVDSLVDMTDEENPLLISAKGCAFLSEPKPPNLLSKYIVAIDPEEL